MIRLHRMLLLAARFVAIAPLVNSGISAQSPARRASPDQSTTELARLIEGLTVTPRVLMIGMHPDDEDTRLITWLSRGRNIQTAYLSITRGEAGLNFGGSESGAALGAIRTEEVLAARRIDGAEQYFTRAFDFGAARTIRDVFDQWNRDSLVGDIVAVIRSFRPHVLIAMIPDSATRDDGQHQALELLVVRSVAEARDSTRFRAFGAAWTVRNLYQPGSGGFVVETSGYDRGSGKTFAELTLESRSQHRSQGLARLTEPRLTTVPLKRIPLGGNAQADSSMFGGIDTSFARLSVGALPALVTALGRFEATADSVRRTFDPRNPSAVVPLLTRTANLAMSLRMSSKWCRHPSASAAAWAVPLDNCDEAALDLDASVDLVRDRAVSALLAAAGVSVEATADRELVAASDTATVGVTVRNHGSETATITDLTVWGGPTGSIEPIVVRPGDSARVTTRVAGSDLAEARPWWIGPRGGPKRGGERFAEVVSSMDGILRNGLVPAPMPSVTIPETIRRTSDVRISILITGVTVSTSVGPVIFRHADPVVGLQHRQLAGVPDVTLQFSRALEWIPKGKPLTRALHVAVKSHLDREQEIDLSIATPQGMPDGMRIDSLPKTLTLGPREQRDLLVQLRGNVTDTDRKAIALIGKSRAVTPRESRIYDSGLQLIQREYLPPIRTMSASGEWMQPVDISVPSSLTTLYVPGGIDDIAGALRQVGSWVTTIESADQLLTVDLSRVSTILIGVRAFEIHPDLAGQSARLLEFVRKGGTLVVLRGGAATLTSGVMPYRAELASPVAERVLRADAPVRVLQPASRILTWPNRITEYDWLNWVATRSESVPTTVDARYGTLIETHDTGEPDNRNSILTTKLGKGILVYTTLTLEQQIAGGVPGAMRLLVNLLSAGLPSGERPSR